MAFMVLQSAKALDAELAEETATLYAEGPWNQRDNGGGKGEQQVGRWWSLKSGKVLDGHHDLQD
jgi:hypothetical protein